VLRLHRRQKEKVMEITPAVALTGIALNALALLAFAWRDGRWRGVVDTQLANIHEAILALPCRTGRCRPRGEEVV